MFNSVRKCQCFKPMVPFLHSLFPRNMVSQKQWMQTPVDPHPHQNLISSVIVFVLIFVCSHSYRYIVVIYFILILHCHNNMGFLMCLFASLMKFLSFCYFFICESSLQVLDISSLSNTFIENISFQFVYCFFFFPKKCLSKSRVS